jgi:2-oxoglutarate dehydrogenase E2 component (dihydrolipoamide succinyltransferase)
VKSEKAEEKKKKETKTENKSDEKIEAEPAVILPEAKQATNEMKASPVAAAMMADKKVDPKKITPSGPEGRF